MKTGLIIDNKKSPNFKGIYNKIKFELLNIQKINIREKSH